MLLGKYATESPMISSAKERKMPPLFGKKQTNNMQWHKADKNAPRKSRHFFALKPLIRPAAHNRNKSIKHSQKNNTSM